MDHLGEQLGEIPNKIQQLKNVISKTIITKRGLSLIGQMEINIHF